MAARSNRSPGGILVCLADPLIDRQASTARCGDTSCSPPDRVDNPPPSRFDHIYAGRIPRFAYFAKHRLASMGRARPQDEKTAPVMDQSNEKGVK